MPEDKDALIVFLYKNKGSKANCRNCRGISILSITRKILAQVILNWLIIMSEANLPEAQCGFHPGGSTVNMIFSVRQAQEKCIELNLDLYSVRPLIQSTERPSGLYWHGTGPHRRPLRPLASSMSAWSIWSFWDLQLGEARLCPGTSSFQLVLQLHPQLHCTGSWWHSVYPLPLWWFCNQSLLTQSQVKDSD